MLFIAIVIVEEFYLFFYGVFVFRWFVLRHVYTEQNARFTIQSLLNELSC